MKGCENMGLLGKIFAKKEDIVPQKDDSQDLNEVLSQLSASQPPEKKDTSSSAVSFEVDEDSLPLQQDDPEAKEESTESELDKIDKEIAETDREISSTDKELERIDKDIEETNRKLAQLRS